MANRHVNAIVVGAGAGGGVVAKELSEEGLSVVLFERGALRSWADHGDDELRSQRTRVLGNAYGPDSRRYRRVVKARDGAWRTVLPHEGAYNNNAACVGGGTLSYGAMAWRFMPQDFRMKSEYGAPEGSTLDDWPISYEDLEPFYEKAEQEIGVAGDDSRNPFAPPRKTPLPMPPFPYNTEGRILDEAGRRLGWHPFPIPMLRNSKPYGDPPRPRCVHRRACVGFACPVDAKNGSHNTVIPRAIATGLCELRAGTVVAEVMVDARGRARGVRYFDEEGKGRELTSDIVVVAASATETARLLLSSRSRLFPEGIGNEHDWVGRNLQGHAYTGAFGLFDRDVYDDAGPGATIAFCDFNHGNEGLRGGGLLANEFVRLPYLFTRVRPPGEPRWGLGHKEFQRKYFRRHIGVKGPVQEMPVFASRVELDPKVTDHWGLPVARISGHRHEHDIEIARFLAGKAEEILREAGATRVWQTTPGRGVSGGQHQAGTCRMGRDPKTSVTDPHGRVHSMPNLFVADGSLCVTNGGFNPALTIFALAYRVSDHIRREWKASGLRG